MASLPTTEAIILEENEGWLTVWFNTPENRNALSDKLAGELTQTIEAIRDNRTIRGVTLRGKGGVFCAGGDLKAFHTVFQGGAEKEAVAASNREGGALFAALNALPQVVIALVDGAAIAGGLGLVCCCDIVAVTAKTKFSLTETQLGIVPAQIAPFVVQRLGQTAARRLMLTGARFLGADAKDIGVADFVVDDDAGLDAVETTIKKQVLRCAPGANAATKEILMAAPAMAPDALSAFAADRFAECMLSEEGREGVAAFVEKRRPSWAPEE